MKENPYWIAPEGLPFIAFALVLTIGLTWAFGWIGGLIPFLGLAFCIWFFRDPTRQPPVAKGDDSRQPVVSPADGTVVAVTEVEETRLLNRKVKRVSIFMSPLNVHVNRAPVPGEVLKTHYNPGKFFNAKGEKASLDNEQNAIIMKTVKGLEIMFVQIAGFIARRIVCHTKPGDQLNIGQRMGLIRFGSRADVYMPLEAEINVTLNQKVKAGETIIAWC